jgi:hypothetical protein
MFPDSDIGEAVPEAIRRCKVYFGERPFDEGFTFSNGAVFSPPDPSTTSKPLELTVGIKTVDVHRDGNVEQEVRRIVQQVERAHSQEFRSAKTICEKAVALADLCAFDNAIDHGCKWFGALGSAWQELNRNGVDPELNEEFCTLMTHVSPDVESADVLGIMASTMRTVRERARLYSCVALEDGNTGDEHPDYTLAVHMSLYELGPTARELYQSRLKERIENEAFDQISVAAMSHGVSVDALHRGDFKRGRRTGNLYNIWETRDADEPLDNPSLDDLMEEKKEDAAETIEETEREARARRGTRVPRPVFRESDVSIPDTDPQEGLGIFEPVYRVKLVSNTGKRAERDIIGNYEVVVRKLAMLPEHWKWSNIHTVRKDGKDLKIWSPSDWHLHRRPQWRRECPSCGAVEHRAPEYLEMLAAKHKFTTVEEFTEERPVIHIRGDLKKATKAQQVHIEAEKAGQKYLHTRKQRVIPGVDTMLMKWTISKKIENLRWMTNADICELLALAVDSRAETRWRELAPDGKNYRLLASDVLKRLFGNIKDILTYLEKRAPRCECKHIMRFRFPRTLDPQTHQLKPATTLVHQHPVSQEPKDIEGCTDVSGALTKLPLRGFRPDQLGSYVEQVGHEEGKVATLILKPDWITRHNGTSAVGVVGTVKQFADSIRELRQRGMLGREVNNTLRVNIDAAFDHSCVPDGKSICRYLKALIRGETQAQMMTEVYKPAEAGEKERYITRAPATLAKELAVIVKTLDADGSFKTLHQYRRMAGRGFRKLNGAMRRWAWTFLNYYTLLLTHEAWEWYLREMQEQSEERDCFISALTLIQKALFKDLSTIDRNVDALPISDQLIFLLHDAIRRRRKQLEAMGRDKVRQAFWFQKLTKGHVKPALYDDLRIAFKAARFDAGLEAIESTSYALA